MKGTVMEKADLPESPAELGRRLAAPFLHSGERLDHALVGKKILPQKPARGILSQLPVISEEWYCLAMTQEQVILIELDPFWNPGKARRILNQDISFRWEPGEVTDLVTLSVTGEEPLELDVEKAFRWENANGD